MAEVEDVHHPGLPTRARQTAPCIRGVTDIEVRSIRSQRDCMIALRRRTCRRSLSASHVGGRDDLMRRSARRPMPLRRSKQP